MNAYNNPSLVGRIAAWLAGLSALAGGSVDTANDKLLVYDADAGVSKSLTPAALATALGFEEGTWTPTISGDGGAPTVSMTVNNAYYVKIGSFVWFSFDVSVTSWSGGSGNVYFSLPATPAARFVPTGNVSEVAGWGAAPLFGQVYSNGRLLLAANSTGTSFVTTAAMSGDETLRFSGSFSTT